MHRLHQGVASALAFSCLGLLQPTTQSTTHPIDLCQRTDTKMTPPLGYMSSVLVYLDYLDSNNGTSVYF